MDTKSENGSSTLPPKHLKTISGLEVFVFCLWFLKLIPHILMLIKANNPVLSDRFDLSYK